MERNILSAYAKNCAVICCLSSRTEVKFRKFCMSFLDLNEYCTLRWKLGINLNDKWKVILCLLSKMSQPQNDISKSVSIQKALFEILWVYNAWQVRFGNFHFKWTYTIVNLKIFSDFMNHSKETKVHESFHFTKN